MKKIVVLGGGYAGVLTAKHLAKKYKDPSQVKITLIDKNPYHTMLTELHEVAADRVDEDSIKISLKRVFAKRNVDVVLDKIANIDYDAKKLTGENGTYAYDYLVMASGSKPTFFGVPGAEEHTFKLWSYDDAVKLKDHFLNTFRAASQEPNKEKRRKLLTFFVVGAGFSGVEMVGEMAEWFPILCEKFEIAWEDVSIYDIDGLDRPVPVLPEKLSVKTKARMEKMGIKVLMKHGCAGVGADYIELKVGDQVKRFECSTVIWTAGIEGSEIVTAAGKSITPGGRGRIQTDQYLRSVERKEVFIAGDNMFYIQEGEKMPVPQMVENCEQCSETIANNIAASIDGKELHAYKFAGHGVMVCIGGRYGLANVGTGNFWLQLPSFFAMFTKHFINVVYFIQVLGWNKIYSYIWHEFFSIRNNRSFVGGHFSNKSPNFWLVPFRVWLGFFWVYEAIKKINEGWFKEAHLTSFLGLDATSGASAAAAAPAADIFNFGIGESFLRFIMMGGEKIAFKIQFSPIGTMMSNMFVGNDGTQIVFQTIIVLAELCVGLALMAGLFTFLASAVSLVLQMMFMTSTGLYMESWWMFFGGIATLVGAGGVLGLDYYVIPALKRWWKKTGFARKTYLYHD